MLIRDKKLPSSVENERKNLYASSKGKELMAGANALQNEIQGIANQAMASSKQERGTTGVPNEQLENVMDRIDNHSHKPAVSASSKSSLSVVRYRRKEDGGWVETNRPKGYQRKRPIGFRELFPKKK